MVKSSSKSSKKRKNAPEKIASVTKKMKEDATLTVTAPPPPPNEDSILGGLLYEDELETTTETLSILAKNPGLISLKALKPFKTAVYDYWRVAHETTNTGALLVFKISFNSPIHGFVYIGNSLTSKISSALVDQRHVDALVLLAEMVIREQVPKLGALQRWVRECDAVLTPSMSKEEEGRVWQVLDAILRTTQPEMIAKHQDTDEGILKPGSRLRWYTPFTVPPTSTTVHSDTTLPDPENISAAAVKVLKPLQTTPGHERRPPNKHPAVIYFSPPNTFPLLPLDQRSRQPQRHDLPGVPGAFTINDVLEPSECAALVKAAEAVGLLPDEPIAGSAAQLSSVLAHNLIWLADTEFISTLYQRIVHFLPQTVHGGAVTGINARFRLYRYRPGALYRPHVRPFHSSFSNKKHCFIE